MANEPYGTTPLPAKGAVWFDPSATWDIAQQPKSQQIAVYDGTRNDECINGATVLDVNLHFVIYAVKKGLIRILHRHSTLRTLFRGHADCKVTDIRFFQDGDVLGSVATKPNGSSSVIVWRVFERTPEIMSEKLLEISTNAFTIARMVWHPFNPNQFWILRSSAEAEIGPRRNVATLVETTRITTVRHETESHAVCLFHDNHIVMDQAVQLDAEAVSSLADLEWSECDARHVLTVHEGGEIRLWDLKKVESTRNENKTLVPFCLCKIEEEGSHSRCKFLPHESPANGSVNADERLTNCFITAVNNNSVVTLWSPFRTGAKPSKLQVFGIENPSTSYLLDFSYAPGPPDGSPPSSFIILADQYQGKIFAWHLRSSWNDERVLSLVGSDYVVPFESTHPMYAMSTKVAPATDISEDDLSEQGGLIFDMKVFSYQSKVIQCLTLTSFMCLPPESSWSEITPGVRTEKLHVEPYSSGASAVDNSIDNSIDFEGEEYDIDSDDGIEADQADFEGAPEASSLPQPEGLESPVTGSIQAPAMSNTPFGNWLGALGAKSSAAPPPPPTFTAPATQPATVDSLPMTTGSALMTPADLLPRQPAQEVSANTSFSAPLQPQATREDKGRKKSRSPKRNTKSSSKAGSVMPSKANGGKKVTAPITILKRDMNGAPEEKATVPFSSPPAVTPEMSALTSATGEVGTSSESSVDNALVQKGLADMLKQHEAMVGKRIESAVHAEVSSTVLPLIEQRVKESVAESIRPLMAKLDSIAAEGVVVDNDKIVQSVTRSVDEPLQAAFSSSMKQVLIPAFEAVSAQMFSQISSTLDNGMTNLKSKEMEQMADQLSQMTALVGRLSDEVENLKRIVSTQSNGSMPVSTLPSNVTAPVDPKFELQTDVMSKLMQRQYESAFTKALSASTVEMALFVCSNSDVGEVLGGSTPTLSQPILLCLMHQLGSSVITSVTSDLHTELIWLQEISLSINPADETIKRHLPGVLGQLVNGITAKMNQPNQAPMRRSLQRLLQVLRGIQV